MVMTAPSHIPNTPRRRLLVGAALPQNEIGNDPDILRDFAQGIEALGFNHLVIYDHVLGADTSVHKGDFLYSHKDAFHEPFVTLGFLAGATRHLGFATSVLVLAQRQTALVAKQAAEVDLICRGRLRLGVSVGWNAVEHQAVGTDFATRGARIVEQVEVLRAFWTQDTVTFRGRFHTIEAAGINPLPVQRPIPILMGGEADVVLRRIGRIADGWYPNAGAPNATHHRQLGIIRAAAVEAGRKLEDVDVEPRINIILDAPDTWPATLQAWERLGSRHLFVSTMRAGLMTLDAHLRRLEEFRNTVPEYFSTRG